MVTNGTSSQDLQAFVEFYIYLIKDREENQ